MNAPDKIYVREFPQGLNQMWSSVLATETSAIKQHEYIRKDALLAWLNERLLETAKNLRFTENKTYAQVLNKINSL